MRLLIVLRGIPASGKSTFIKEHDLEGFTLCPDDYRVQIGGLTVDEIGKQHIPEQYNKKVWQRLFEDIEFRMKEGITTVVDATHTRESYFNDYNKLCEKYRYRMIIVEFKEDLDVCKQRNAERIEYKQYPDEVLEKMYQQMQNPIASKYQKMMITPDQFESTINKILYNNMNLDSYSSVLVVGDIHGCYTALIDALKQAKFIKSVNDDGSFIFDDSMFVIFVGDYIDRGLENAQVVEFLYSIKDFSNVKLLEGNHETHLLKLSREGGWDNPYQVIGYAPETCKTVSSLTPDQKKKLSLVAQKCGYYFSFKYEGKIYTVTHSAIPCTNRLNLSANQIIRGINPQKIYTNVDFIDLECSKKVDELLKIWNGHAPTDYYFIHGHANPDAKHSLIHNYNHTYNLCDDVEKGGCLRMVKFQIGKEETVYRILNTVYKPASSLNLNTENADIITELENSPLVHKKDLGDGVASYNFSRKAFYSQSWNHLTTTARGLFVDTNTNEIVARSYPKFFAIEEHGSTEWRNLKTNLKFPVTAYLKENGFLGIVSVYNNELFIASKSTNHGEYKENFERILHRQVNCDKLKEYLSKNKCSAVFECVDPFNDPHIIDYVNEKVVLLDVVQNDFTDTFKPYNEVYQLGQSIGCNVKSLSRTFDTFEELKAFIDIFDQDFTSEIEGFVFVDSNNFMFKYKTPFYKFWKNMRKVKEYVAKGAPVNIFNNIPESQHNLAQQVFDHLVILKSIGTDLTNMSIIDIRHQLKGDE